MGHRHTKQNIIHVRLYDIQKCDNHLLLKCQPQNLLLNYSHKHYHSICKQLKVGQEYKFSYYCYCHCYIINKLIS